MREKEEDVSDTHILLCTRLPATRKYLNQGVWGETGRRKSALIRGQLFLEKSCFRI